MTTKKNRYTYGTVTISFKRVIIHYVILIKYKIRIMNNILVKILKKRKKKKEKKKNF